MEEVKGNPSLKVRSIELKLETFHILPKGFFLAVLPSVTFNLNQDFNFFTLGLGVGRALTRQKIDLETRTQEPRRCVKNHVKRS